MEQATSVSQALWFLPSKQRTPDQGPDSRSVVYRASGIKSACQWTATRTQHPHRHTDSVPWICFQRKYFTRYVRIKQEVQQRFLLPLNGGLNNLKSHNQRWERSTGTLCCSKCSGPMHYFLGQCWICKSRAPWQELHRGPEVVIIHHRRGLWHSQMSEVLRALLLGQ